jgi:thymidine kinase
VQKRNEKMVIDWYPILLLNVLPLSLLLFFVLTDNKKKNVIKRKTSFITLSSTPEEEKNSATLHVFCGPMYASKTSRLIGEITLCADVLLQEEEGEKKILLINHIWDKRDKINKISSHSSSYRGISNKIEIKSCEKLSEINVDDYIIIGVDEGQFFTDLYDTIVLWLEKGKHIYVSGLDGDANMKKFGQVVDLCPIANTFVKLESVCTHCIQEKRQAFHAADLPKAAFTGKFVKGGNLVDIGAEDKYVSLCRRHFTLLKGE